MVIMVAILASAPGGAEATPPGRSRCAPTVHRRGATPAWGILGKMITASSLASRVDAAIDRVLAEQRLVGVTVLIALDGEIAYRRSAGFADREAQRPLREDDIF